MRNSDGKIEMYMAPDALPEFLRELAEALEARGKGDQGAAGGELRNQVRGYKKLRLGIKRKAGQVSVKLKIKKPDLPPPLAVAAEAGQVETADSAATKAATAELTETLAVAVTAFNEEKPKYKILKKRMKSGFKEIRARLAELRLPEEAVVRQFCDDSALMVTYPGMGDPHYVRYTRVVSELQAAYAGKDFARFNSLVSTLSGLKDECHKEYK
jgi:XXXCH domain-containing protein